ncbi:polysaccharide lyase family 1 protein [Dysgonomonas sp. 511]|uniref:pectate lyase family protein n=1 Tax=Dysgonomonas sp. 511 TaxID=2302930 RepID=UPI0013D2D019|nr:polysaccharide lyase family 1 protein [Dysgonomonas sp. 511]NDV77970.1 hypothetical protein [Dysgonomonas sp. 511]
MKKLLCERSINWYSLFAILCIVFLVSCSDEDDPKGNSSYTEIPIAEIIGTYQVSECLTYPNSGRQAVADESQIGNIWMIFEKAISIDCGEKVAHSYAYNTMTTTEKNMYAVSKEGDRLVVTYTSASKILTKVYLEPTTNECEDIDDIVNEILIEEITGTYEVIAYEVLTGANQPKSEGEIGNLWVIGQESVSINCGEEQTHTYANNTFTIGGSGYEVSFNEDKNLVVIFPSGNDKIKVTLKETTEKTCDNGDDGGGEEEITPPTVGKVELDKLYGYAEGTTGGEGATTANIHHFNDGKKFQTWLLAREKAKSAVPAIVWLSGTFKKDDGRAANSPWFDIKRTKNISIYGTNDFVMENIGFFLNEAENIIIRNVYIKMPKADNGADGISMQESSKVWVDHCTFESINQTKDYEDGSCDITHATKQVTVSWNRFIKTQKSCLVGHSNGATADVDITATFHHNYFEKSSSRHPRVRFGKAHVYNNFFDGVTTYGVGSAYGAKVLVEYNNFDNVHLPTDICTFPAKKSGSSWVSNLTGSVAGYLYEYNNTYTNKPSNASDPYPFTNVEYKAYNGEKLATPLTYDDFKPTYNYVVDTAEDIATIVPSATGVGKLPGYASAPIAVDNGGIAGGGDDGGDGGDDGGGDDGGETGVAIGGGWLAMNVGDAAGVNTASSDGTGITMVGKGKFESSAQTFSYVYREVTGNFEMTVRLDDYTSPTAKNQGQAGILFTPDISQSASNLLFAMSSKGGDGTYVHMYRLTAGTNGKATQTAPTGSGNVYLKIRREGNKSYASYSLDGGVTFGTEKNKEFSAALPEKLYIGFAVNSSDNSKTATAKFSDVKLNGTSLSFVD